MSVVIGKVFTENGVTHAEMYNRPSRMPKTTEGNVIFPLIGTSYMGFLGFLDLYCYTPTLTYGRLSKQELLGFFLKIQPILDNAKETVKCCSYFSMFMVLIAILIVGIGLGQQQIPVAIAGTVGAVIFALLNCCSALGQMSEMDSEIQSIVQNNAKFYLEKGLKWEYISDNWRGRWMKLTCTNDNRQTGAYLPPINVNSDVNNDVILDMTHSLR